MLLVAMTTKPTDQECLDQVSAHYSDTFTGGLIFGARAGRVVYQVQDHIFYKTITNRINGHCVGAAVFSTIFFL